METYGWWSLADFLAEAESSPKEAVTKYEIMTGLELQILFNNNDIKTSYGSNYSQKGGRGIHRVILSAWGYYYKKGDYQTALDIARAFVGKDLEYTYR